MTPYMFEYSVIPRNCMGCVWDGGSTSKCVGMHQRGPQHMREVVAGARAHEGHMGHVWDGSAASIRGGVHRNALGCIEGGCGVCVRSWLGLGHMKGVWDTSGMAEAH